MGDWADIEASEMFREWQDEYGFDGRYDGIIVDVSAALRQAEARGRRNAIERSAELIGRQVEPRDA